MDATKFYSATNETLQARYLKSIEFIEATLPAGSTILDLGIDNPLAHLMRQRGFGVLNTRGEDLDDAPESLTHAKADAATAFEILEHLVNPLGVLRAIQTPRLYVTVPLALWFAKAYRHPTDIRDRHFHEFEDWQFDWLLEKAGWKIVRAEKWKSTAGVLGIRPILRAFTARYYAIEATRV